MSISRQERKQTQRPRLLDGMLRAAVHNGYAGANIADVIAHARVSRPTFYEYFSDRDDCFLAVHAEISRKMIERVLEAVRAEPPERAVQAAVEALVSAAEAEPEEARFLVNETLAGGRRILDARDRTIASVERIVEDVRAQAGPEAPTPDISTAALIGGVCNALAPRLRRNETDLRRFAEALVDWIDRYRRPTAEHRWRTLRPGPQLPPPKHVSELALRPPPPLPPGRPSMSGTEVTRNQRERILYATAEVAVRKGYTATTVADITGAAGLDRRVFYANFSDKQDAFMAVHNLVFQQVMAVCASAFFSGSSWPERIWEGLRAGTYFDASYPIFAHVKYIEGHAVGSSAIQRIEDSHAAFTIFAQEGFTYTDSPPSRSILDAMSATGYEIGYQHARRGTIDQLPRLTPHAAFLVLAPFIGAQAANDFIDEQLSRLRPRAGASRDWQSVAA